MIKESRYFDPKPEPEILQPRLIEVCPACEKHPVVVINKPLHNKFNWEIKTSIECRNEDCEVKPKVTGCVVRRNEHLAHDFKTSQVATKLAYDQWPPTINRRLLHNAK